MGKSILKEKSYEFALAIVKLTQMLQNDKKEFVLSKQLLRSGTSVGALIREAEYGQSKMDFIHKLSIALKESNETEYWLSLLGDSGYLGENEIQTFKNGCNEITAMLVASVKTGKGMKSGK